MNQESVEDTEVYFCDLSDIPAPIVGAVDKRSIGSKLLMVARLS